MNLRPGRALLHLGQLLLRLGIWMCSRWAETAQAIAEPNQQQLPVIPAQMPGPTRQHAIILTWYGQPIDFSCQPQELQRLVALSWFLGALRQRGLS